MSKHRPFDPTGLGLCDAISGEPQLYARDTSTFSAGSYSWTIDVLPASNPCRAFGRLVAWCLHHLNAPSAVAVPDSHRQPVFATTRSTWSEATIRNAGSSEAGFAP